MAQRKKSVSADEAAIEADVRAGLEREGVVKLAGIKPAAVRASLVAKLGAEGVEVTKAVLRRPLLAQLKEALSHGALVPLKSVSTHVRGGTPAELKGVVEAAVRGGVARRVQRGAVEALVGAEVAVLSAAELKALRERLVGVTKSLEKVFKKPGLSLLVSDVTEGLAEATAAVGGRGAAAVSGGRGAAAASGRSKGGAPQAEAPQAEAPRADAMQAVLEAVDAARDERTGLSFVPAVVGRLTPALSEDQAMQLLVAAAERELLELRPEGGIGRLSAAERAVCPPGPHQTHLSWARRLPGGAP